MTDESTDLTDALNNPDNWSSSGPGTHEINSSEHDISFSYYDAESGSITYESTVENDGEVQFSWVCIDSRSIDDYHNGTSIGTIETDTEESELYPSDSLHSRTVNPLKIRPSADNRDTKYQFQTRNVTTIEVTSGDTVRLVIEAHNSGVLSGFFEPAPNEEFVGLYDPPEPSNLPVDDETSNSSTVRTLQSQQSYPTIKATADLDDRATANTEEGYKKSTLPMKKNVELPVILAEFSDVKGRTPKEYIKEIFFRDLNDSSRKKDAQGNDAWKKDAQGNFIKDANGNKIPKFDVKSYSVNEYFKEISDGNLSYKPSDVIGWVDTGMPRSQATGPKLLPQKAYTQNLQSLGPQYSQFSATPYTWDPFDTDPAVEFIKQAIIQAHEELKNKQRNRNENPVGLRTYANNDKLSVAIIFAGISRQIASGNNAQELEKQKQNPQYNPNLVQTTDYLLESAVTQFSYKLQDIDPATNNNQSFTITIKGYTQTSEEAHSFDTSKYKNKKPHEHQEIKGSSVIAHELGHLQFGWGDLYTDPDSKIRSTLTDEFSLMGMGVYGKVDDTSGSDQSSPLHPLAFRKLQNGIDWGNAPELKHGHPGILPPANKVNDFYQRASPFLQGQTKWPNVSSWPGVAKRYVSYRPAIGSDQGLKSLTQYPNWFNKIPHSNNNYNFDGMLVWDTNIERGGTFSVVKPNPNPQPGQSAQITVQEPIGTDHPETKLDYDFVEVGMSGAGTNDPGTIDKNYGTILINDPEHRELNQGQQAVYAIDTSLNYDIIDSRVSWDGSAASKDAMDLILDDTNNTSHVSKNTNIAYTSVQSDGLPSKSGSKLIEEARKDVSYYTATNYNREPLPTRLEITGNNLQLDAGDHSNPNRITIEVEAYNGNQVYDSDENPSFDVTVGSQTVPQSNITIQTGSSNSRHILEIQPPQKPAGTHQLGITLTDRKHGVEHTTNQLTADVTFQGEWFNVKIVDPNTPNLGDTLHVTAEVTNTGLGSGTKDVTFSLYRASDSPSSQPKNISLAPQQKKDPSADFPINHPGHYTITVDSGDHHDVKHIHVKNRRSTGEKWALGIGIGIAAVTGVALFAGGGWAASAGLALIPLIADGGDPKIQAETLIAPLAVGNPTEDPITEEATLRVPGLDVPVTTTEIELASNEYTTKVLSVDLPEDAVGDYTAEIEFGDKSITEPVTIPEPTEPNFGVRVLEERNPVEPGEEAMVTVEVRNAGDEEKTAPLMYHLDGDGRGFSGSVVSTEVTLGPGEIKIVTLSTPASSGEGESGNVKHLPTYAQSYINNKVISESIRLEPPAKSGSADFIATIDDTWQTDYPYHPGVTSIVEYTIENDDEQEDSQIIGFNYFDSIGEHISGHEESRTVPGDSSEQFSNEFVLETTAGSVEIATPYSDSAGDKSQVPGPDGEEPAYFEVDIDYLPSTVVEGETVDVEFTVTNVGEMEGTQDIQLTDKADSSHTYDSTVITVDKDDSGSGTFEYEIPSGSSSSDELSLTVRSEQDSDTHILTVREPAYFEVDIDQAPDTAVAGETVDVECTVTNTGEVEETQDITLEVDGSEEDSEEVTLDNGSTAETLTWNTSSLDSGSHTLTVSSDDDQDQIQNIEIQEPVVEFNSEITDVFNNDNDNPTTDTDWDTDVDYEITNEGNTTGTREVRYSTTDMPSGETVEINNSLTLGSGESVTGSFDIDDGSYWEKDEITIEITDPGTKSLQIGNVDGFVDDSDNPTTRTDWQGYITYDVTNTGDTTRTETITTEDLTWDKTIDSRRVTVNPDNTKSIRFDIDDYYTDIKVTGEDDSATGVVD